LCIRAHARLKAGATKPEPGFPLNLNSFTMRDKLKLALQSRLRWRIIIACNHWEIFLN
jgi:hypothetical protein